MDKKQPFQRNWLAEAYKIAKGDTTIAPKREHIAAAVNTLIDIKARAEQLKKIMMKAYNDACAKRKAQGLSNPPMPPSLLTEDLPS